MIYMRMRRLRRKRRKQLQVSALAPPRMKHLPQLPRIVTRLLPLPYEVRLLRTNLPHHHQVSLSPHPLLLRLRRLVLKHHNSLLSLLITGHNLRRLARRRLMRLFHRSQPHPLARMLSPSSVHRPRSTSRSSLAGFVLPAGTLPVRCRLQTVVTIWPRSLNTLGRCWIPLYHISTDVSHAKPRKPRGRLPWRTRRICPATWGGRRRKVRTYQAPG
ncbi:hypothetical protein I7I50_07528 [Histoplasma capsulatum G186AR]|uniref:Uncharacterized protein n=1 Tax=Ajellomyces capsulatus TaxID=5037 RepID=A0A8H7YZF6_AJECA|nr:hypothetical protein I7I52_09400 [Histoplasma capsulatum]QSS68197.1 hypothetical protein I7I50_07528 [Histoplasma capsulatum G186AR]